MPSSLAKIEATQSQFLIRCGGVGKRHVRKQYVFLANISGLTRARIFACPLPLLLLRKWLQAWQERRVCSNLPPHAMEKKTASNRVE